jgi:predicted  nucleic acid-binding Zn-ribbon protein
MPLAEQLYDLYLLDKQVRGMSSRLDAANRRLQLQQNRLAQLEQQHSELADQLLHTRAKATELEKQADEFEQRIGTDRDRMNSANNNKEFSALLIEVNTLKTDKGKVEDEALEQMTHIDTLEQELSEMAARVEQQSKLVNSALGDVETCRSEVGDQLEQLGGQRSVAEQNLPTSARSQFNRIAEMHEGEAMAQVVETSRRNKEYTCGGCYLSMPFERLNALMNTDEIVTCPSCGRILYLETKLKASFVK